MSSEKGFYKQLLKDMFSNPCNVQFWDGEIMHYGEGEAAFTLIFKEPISKADIVKDASLAFGEAFMDNKIEVTGDLQKVIESLYNNAESFLRSGKFRILQKMIPNNTKKSKENVQHHYDIGNDFYKLWLDDTMTYSCGYFQSEKDNLTQAQLNKVGHILKKLNIKKDETLLDIGCGWGELIIAAAKKYGAKSLGITLSTEQYDRVKERIQEEGLVGQVDVAKADYRELKNRHFDKVVSVGMIEHVGKNNLGEYFDTVKGLLEKGGVSMVHCITGISDIGVNNWINKYIFPGGYIPTVREMITHMEERGLHTVDLESLRLHYARTLEHWSCNFENALDEVRKTKDERFIRMWRLYLNACAASFTTGNIDVHQILFTKGINQELPWTREYMYAQ